MAGELQRVELQGGAEAYLATSMKWKERKALMQQIGAMPDDPADVDVLKGIDAIETILSVLIRHWTVKDDAGQPLSLPSENREILGELDARDFDALVTAANAIMAAMMPPKASSDT